MSYVQVLQEIEARGLSIAAVGADLRLQGPRERMDTDLIRLVKANKVDLLAHLGASGGFALTELQRSYLVGRGDGFDIGNVASHVYHEIHGAWDIDRLESALQSVIARHGMLRTRFTADGRQIEEARADLRIARLDLRGQTETAQRDRLMVLREQRSHRILPADRAPLLAAEVTILADTRMVLHVSHDGLVMDAISMFLFFQAWWSAYGHHDDSGSEPEASFETYVAALEHARDGAPAQRSRKYWLERLDNLASHPDLPLATSPSTITSPRFSSHFARLDHVSWAALKTRAAQAGLTPSGLLFTAYAETLACWGAGPCFTINTTVANRPPIHPRILQAIGNFGQTMLVEVTLDRRLSFADRARALQAQLRRELDNRHFSGIEVMRELSRRRGTVEARMPYTFNSALGYVRDGVDGSALELFGAEVYTSSQTPQVWLDVTAFEQHDGVVVEFDSVDGLYPDGLIESMVSGYQGLLEALLDESAWSATQFDLLPKAQKARRREANTTTTVGDAPGPGLLPDAFLAQAERAPDAPAILTTTGTISYAELRRRALHAATWLRGQQVGRNELVGLVMRRGPEQIVGILATLLAGAAYLPVDAALPAQRRKYMLVDGRVRCVLTNVESFDSGDPPCAVLALDASEPVDMDAPLDVPPAPGANADDLAYVLYTSGTTGEPKGVMVSQRSVTNVVADCNGRFGIGPRDRFFGISAFHFDLSVFDVFGALSAGAAVVMPDPDKASDPVHWLRLCGSAGVTVWNSVPAIVSLLHDQAVVDGAGPLAALRLVMMSGDRIPPPLPAALRKLKADLRIIALGGPTETTIWNILHPTDDNDDVTHSIPYGRPNANNRAYVLDENGCDMPDWVAGEICAAGVGLARGYWGDEALTRERFFYDPRRGERLYRTGDLGRYLPNGEIDILGRRDFQIKLNGNRIEAGEVETRLVALEGVRQAVVVRQNSPRGDRLVAHLVPAGDQRPSDALLREALRRHVPEYMVPSEIHWHASLPLTRNGKVDRAQMSAWMPSSPGPATGDAPDSELERQVAGLWAKVMRLPDVDVTSTLYDLGGDSLTAARILAGVRRQFGITIALDRLPQVETVRAMAAQIGLAGARALDAA
jgi:pyochelin synthetase